MNRRLGYTMLLFAMLCLGGSALIEGFGTGVVPPALGGTVAEAIIVQSLLVIGAILATIGGYFVVSEFLLTRTEDRRRRHDLRNVSRLAFVLVGIVGILAVLTQQYVGLLFSLGVVGFAVTFSLQQPLFSFVGWLYIILKRPYEVGDRVAFPVSRSR